MIVVINHIVINVSITQPLIDFHKLRILNKIRETRSTIYDYSLSKDSYYLFKFD